MALVRACVHGGLVLRIVRAGSNMDCRGETRCHGKAPPEGEHVEGSGTIAARAFHLVVREAPREPELVSRTGHEIASRGQRWPGGELD
jgi:hypothetical protein